MIAPDLIAIIYQRISLVDEAILTLRSSHKDAVLNDKWLEKLTPLISKTNALRTTVAKRVELPNAQFSSTMADVENACLLLESELKSFPQT